MSYYPTAAALAAPAFVAVDFETANRMGGVSACEIGLVRFEQGKVVAVLESKLCPPPGYQHFEFTHIHGLCFSDVAAAPSWEEFAGAAAAFIAGLPVFAHSARFDARVWRDLDRHYGTVSYPSKFYCSYEAAKRLLPGLSSYRLTSVLAACEPEHVFTHHRAVADAEACGRIIAHLQRHITLELP